MKVAAGADAVDMAVVVVVVVGVEATVVVVEVAGAEGMVAEDATGRLSPL
jgi:hypothetical protein